MVNWWCQPQERVNLLVHCVQVLDEVLKKKSFTSADHLRHNNLRSVCSSRYQARFSISFDCSAIAYCLTQVLVTATTPISATWGNTDE